MTDPHFRFLHIEDDDGDAVILRRAIQREFIGNFTLDRATTLTEAMATLNDTRFSAVMLDLGLADSHGLRNVEQIAGRFPDTPIVVISGHDDTAVALQALELGAQEFIVKDFSNPRAMGLAVRSSMARKAHERELVRLANHDMLTGLLNRRMFCEYMENRLVSASRWDRSEALLFSDVNRFKQVNDTLGHAAGDQLLREVGCRLQSSLRSSDILARYAGDEFVIHLDGSNHTPDEAFATANRITESFREPITLVQQTIVASLSIGIAFFPAHGQTVDELIHRADLAMYSAKRQGLPYALAQDPVHSA